MSTAPNKTNTDSTCAQVREPVCSVTGQPLSSGFVGRSGPGGTYYKADREDRDASTLNSRVSSVEDLILKLTTAPGFTNDANRKMRGRLMQVANMLNHGPRKWTDSPGRALVRTRIPETDVARAAALFPGLTMAAQLRKVISAGLAALESDTPEETLR